MHELTGKPLSDEEVADLDAYWRAANYLAVGQIYLLGNALLTEPLQAGTSSRASSVTGVRRLVSTCSTPTSTG